MVPEPLRCCTSTTTLRRRARRLVFGRLTRGTGRILWRMKSRCRCVSCDSIVVIFRVVADLSQLDCPESSQAQQTIAQQPSPRSSITQPVGLGIGGLWNVHVEDQLHLRRPEAVIGPVTTKLTVFTTQQGATADFRLPTYRGRDSSCVTCQLWDITNPGQNLKCNECQAKEFVTPAALLLSDAHPRAKIPVPRLDIPKEPQLLKRAKQETTTRCSACEISAQIDPIRLSACPSCISEQKLLSPLSPSQPSKIKRSSARRPPTKLQLHALRVLKAWLRDHQQDPYPDASTKRSLAQECGITEKQVNTWFTNARARRLVSPKDCSNAVSDDEGAYETAHSSVVSTPVGNNSTSLHLASPFEPRSSALATPVAPTVDQSLIPISRRGKKKDYSQMGGNSPISHQASPVPPTPITHQKSPANFEQETWQCTFCYQHIAPKSWRRHEETQHRPKSKWTCLLNGPRLIVPSAAGSSVVCAFCMAENPSEAHFQRSHRITECRKKPEAERTFLRPDHLRQHVKNFHKTQLIDHVRDLWKRDGDSKDEVDLWTCGFCDEVLRTWNARQVHISGHFKDGLTMEHWRSSEQPESSTTSSGKKRRNSAEEHPSAFAKLTRTLTGHSTRQQTQQHLSNHNNDFANAFQPLRSASPSSSNPPMPLLPDPVFDNLMAEICGNPFDTNEPSATGYMAAQPNVADTRYDSAVNDDEAAEFDFDLLNAEWAFDGIFDP